MKVPKGKSFSIGQKTYKEGEEIPEKLVPDHWKTGGKKPDSKKDDKPKK